MNKIILASILLVTLTWVEIVKSDDWNDFFNLLNNLKVTDDCRGKIYQGRKSCEDKLQKDPNDVKSFCCSTWTYRDCLTDLVSKCDSTEKDNFIKNFKRITLAMENGQCRDYAYNSNECSGSNINTIGNTDVDNLENSIDKVLSDKCKAKFKPASKQCFEKIKNYLTSNSIIKLLDDLKKARDAKDEDKIKSIEKPLGYLKCYATDDGHDCLMKAITINECNITEKFNFMKAFDESKIKTACSDFKRSQTPNGSVHISVNSTLFGLTLLYLIYNLLKI